MPLTDDIIENAKPGARPSKLADGRGLYLLTMPSGARYWRLKYRFAGKEKLLALGVYPKVSIESAREQREGARALLSQGIDPISARRQSAREQIKAAALASLPRMKKKGERLIIETRSITVRFTKAETDALRAFLLAIP
jgi:hypothetical protein